jgi:hypothetical protein
VRLQASVCLFVLGTLAGMAAAAAGRDQPGGEVPPADWPLAVEPVLHHGTLYLVPAIEAPRFVVERRVVGLAGVRTGRVELEPEPLGRLGHGVAIRWTTGVVTISATLDGRLLRSPPLAISSLRERARQLPYRCGLGAVAPFLLGSFLIGGLLVVVLLVTIARALRRPPSPIPPARVVVEPLPRARVVSPPRPPGPAAG